MDILNSAVDTIVSPFAGWIYEVFYHIDMFFCRILGIMYRLFAVFVGIEKVTYKNEDMYLINVFFGNSVINTVYAGMALIGIAMCFGFAVWSVIRKMFDLDDKVKQSLGQIIGSVLKAILIIISMNVILMVTIEFSNRLMRQIDFLFNNADAIEQGTEIDFDEEDYATMARIMDKVGNYAINTSYSSRYNINSCFNAIRGDMQKLERKKAFNFSYELEDAYGNPVTSWQSELAAIARAHALDTDQALDEYNAALSASVLSCMEYLRDNPANMTVLEHYERNVAIFDSEQSGLDVMLFLTATSEAAKNKSYNLAPSYMDSLRNPYVSGSKDIYELETVETDFYLDFEHFDHILVLAGGIFLIFEFFGILMNCVARIFNMMLLYLVAPPFVATMPLDEGGKFKQWSTAFIVQSFSVFGNVMAVRLLMVFIPIIFNSELVILNGGFTGMVAKLLLIIGAAFTSRKASDMIAGILADNAGFQAIHAGNMAGEMKSMAGGIVGGAFGAATAIGGSVISGAGGLAKTGAKKTLGGMVSLGGWMSERHDRNALKGDLEKGDKDAAQRFVDMDKDQAKSRYGFNDKAYENTLAKANSVLSGGDGQADQPPGNLGGAMPNAQGNHNPDGNPPRNLGA